MREATVSRNTKETCIELTLSLDGGEVSVDTGIGFFDHMLTALFFYAGFGAKLTVRGDLHVDGHHTVEDTGIAIGPAFVRKGYGRQILMALVNLAFEELGATKFVASCRSQNDASRQLQLACGFVYSHSEDRTDPRNGAPYVLEFYELENNKK